MTRTTSSLIVAVDGGGSRCRVRIVNGKGAILGTAKGGPANISWDYEGARRSITETISRAYTDAGLSLATAPNHVAALALAGAGNQSHVKRLRAHLDFSRVIICSDIEATVHGALRGTDGTVASIGMGSFFFSQFEGRKRRVGGWGFHLSDECSGASLGQSVLRYVTRVHDGVKPTSPLVERIFDGFDRSIDKVVSFSLSATPRDYGSLVPDIAHAFDLGDPVAVRLLEEARNTLCEILDALEVLRTGRLCVIGGLGPTYKRLLPSPYRDIHVDPLGDPLDGIIWIAMNRLEKVR